MIWMPRRVHVVTMAVFGWVVCITTVAGEDAPSLTCTEVNSDGPSIWMSYPRSMKPAHGLRGDELCFAAIQTIENRGLLQVAISQVACPEDVFRELYIDKVRHTIENSFPNHIGLEVVPIIRARNRLIDRRVQCLFTVPDQSGRSESVCIMFCWKDGWMFMVDASWPTDAKEEWEDIMKTAVSSFSFDPPAERDQQTPKPSSDWQDFVEKGQMSAQDLLNIIEVNEPDSVLSGVCEDEEWGFQIEFSAEGWYTQKIIGAKLAEKIVVGSGNGTAASLLAQRESFPAMLMKAVKYLPDGKCLRVFVTPQREAYGLPSEVQPGQDLSKDYEAMYKSVAGIDVEANYVKLLKLPGCRGLEVSLNYDMTSLVTDKVEKREKVSWMLDAENRSFLVSVTFPTDVEQQIRQECLGVLRSFRLVKTASSQTQSKPFVASGYETVSEGGHNQQDDRIALMATAEALKIAIIAVFIGLPTFLLWLLATSRTKQKE